MSPSEDKKVDKILTMSSKEISRLEVMQRLKEKSLSQREAAKMMGVCVRQVKRLYKAYREQGAAGLVSRRRGQSRQHKDRAAVLRLLPV